MNILCLVDPTVHRGPLPSLELLHLNTSSPDFLLHCRSYNYGHQRSLPHKKLLSKTIYGRFSGEDSLEFLIVAKANIILLVWVFFLHNSIMNVTLAYVTLSGVWYDPSTFQEDRKSNKESWGFISFFSGGLKHGQSHKTKITTVIVK